MDIEIRNLSQLRAERSRLKHELKITSLAIETDLYAIKQGFNPLKMVAGFAKNLFFSQQSGIVNDGFRSLIGSFSYDKLLRFLPWPARIVASYLLKNYVTNYVFTHKENIANKVVSIFNIAKSLFSKKSRQDNEREATPRLQTLEY